MEMKMMMFQGWERRDETQMPPGFRFHPTDEELITHYLLKKVLDSTFSCTPISQVDLNKSEPWDLPEKAKMGEKEWYFFTLRDRKYPTGLRTNRATEAGYWKATGKDKEIRSSKTCSLLGIKKTLVFYKGRAPKGEKSCWIMHEFRLHGKFSYHYISSNCSKDEWVICKVSRKTGGGKKTIIPSAVDFYADFPSPSSAPPPPLLNTFPAATEHVSCFSNTAADVSFPTYPPPAPPQFDDVALGPFPSGRTTGVGYCFENNNAGVPLFSNLPVRSPAADPPPSSAVSASSWGFGYGNEGCGKAEMTWQTELDRMWC